jgi:serine/threonine protein kinase
LANQGNRRRGDRFGPFTLGERLGHGNETSVHRATQLDVAGKLRVVALKRMLPHCARDEYAVRAFVNEAKVGMALSHPNIVKLYEHGRIDTEYFISMEYVEGHALPKLLRWATLTNTSPSPQVIVSLLVKLCRALEYAYAAMEQLGHRQPRVGIVPESVVIRVDGEPMIVDLGTGPGAPGKARSRLGNEASALGAGKATDVLDEVWSIGVLAQELVTTRPPSSSEHDFERTPPIRNISVPDPSSTMTGCPPELYAIILRALESTQAMRWQSLGDMADALEKLAEVNGLTVSASPIAAWRSVVVASLPPRELEKDEADRQLGIKQRAEDRNEPPRTPRSRPKPPPIPARALRAPPTVSLSPRQDSIGFEPAALSPVSMPERWASAAGWAQARSPSEAVPPEAPPAKRVWPTGTTTPPLIVDEGAGRSQWRGRTAWLLAAIGVALLIVSALALTIYKRATPTMTVAPTTGTVEVLTIPANANVWIDDEATEQAVELAAGTHHLRAELANYLPWSESFTVRAGTHLQLRIALSEEPTPIVVQPISDAPPRAEVAAVGASLMRRQSGKTLSLPSLRRARRARIRALICVSPEGRVTSSHILSDVSKRASRQLQAQLSTWRYHPISRGDQTPVSACFTDALRLQ